LQLLHQQGLMIFHPFMRKLILDKMPTLKKSWHVILVENHFCKWSRSDNSTWDS